MRRFTPSVQTKALLNSSATIFQASRNIRTRVQKQEESEFFVFKKDFPNLYKLYNHAGALANSHPISFIFMFLPSVIIAWHTLMIPVEINSIKFTLRSSDRKLGRLTNEVGELNQTIASFKK